VIMCARGDEVVRVQVELTRPRRGVGGGRSGRRREMRRGGGAGFNVFGRCEMADELWGRKRMAQWRFVINEIRLDHGLV